MMPVSYNQNSAVPHTGPELDIMEWQSNNPSVIYSTIHAWSNGSDTAAPATNYWSYGSATLSNFNTYGVLWTPTAISWYFNNQLVETISTTSAPFNAQFAGQYPVFLILSQQSGCNWATTCDGQVSPLNMQVQWVHIYTSPATAL
jgi:beta-glucanase (GH16 family)